MTVPLILLALAAVAFGAFPQCLTDWITNISGVIF